MDGVLVIDKPSGMTSHDVIDHVRRRLGTKRVGHGGTLDPDATGVLVVGVGRATRFLSYSQASRKRYEAEVAFGITTDTQDGSGRVMERRAVHLEPESLETALARFRGRLEQLPPMVSAVKVGGERLYRKARRGEQIEREPRRIEVFEMRLVALEVDPPVATLDVTCSAGTYVRTLAHDIGEELGCGAHLQRLRRIEAGGFTEVDSLPLDAVGADTLRPLTDTVRGMPRLEVDEESARRVGHGRALEVVQDLEEGERIALVRDGALLGVYARRGTSLVPERVVAP